MKTYLPRDERIFNWDPENMELYWQQCREFDQVDNNEMPSRDRLSGESFKQMMTTDLISSRASRRILKV